MSGSRGALAVRVGFFLFMCASIAWISSTLAATQIYTYTDDAGTQTFTTDLGSIPERYRSRTVRLDLGPYSAPPVVPAAQRPPSGQVRVVNADGEYRMGDHDTRTEAVRMAIEAAKRAALEQVATYLESVTEVHNLDVTRDDIRAYTAGIVMVQDQRVTTRLEGDTVVIRAEITGQVDPDEVTQAIPALRENESAKTELAALRSETDQLQAQLDAANLALAHAGSPDEIQALSREREEVLNHMQANALVSQAWTDWAYVTPVIYPYPWVGVRQVNGLLLQAQQLHPQNRHIAVAQQIVTTQSAALPPPPPGIPPPGPPHPSLLVPSGANAPAGAPQPNGPLPGSANAATAAGALRAPAAVPPQSLLPGSTNAATSARALRGPAAAPVQQFSPSLPPTLQQVHPPHVAQPNPPVSRAPYSIPHRPPSSIPQHVGGGHVGGGHHGR